MATNTKVSYRLTPDNAAVQINARLFLNP